MSADVNDWWHVNKEHLQNSGSPQAIKAKPEPNQIEYLLARKTKSQTRYNEIFEKSDI